MIKAKLLGDHLKTSQFIKNAVSESFKLHLAGQNQNKYPEYLTITQAAEYLNLATPTIYGFTSKNEIPFLKKGKKLSVVISINEYKKIIEELEELEDIIAYDKAKAEPSNAIPFADFVKQLEN